MFQHRTSYFYSDGHRNRRQAHARIGALDGISAHDELYLWGLLALALNRPDPTPKFMGTPYYCLRQLGAITPTKKGHREFELFRAAIRRLSGVRYENDAFYDPIRGEHRQVSFGLLSYSLPLDEDSSRAWRFAWDPIFFELCTAAGSTLRFDLHRYRDFDPASRRLYLFLKKLFWRKSTTQALDLRHLAVDVLGFRPELELKHFKQKVSRCLDVLLAARVIALPSGVTSVKELFERPSKGQFRVTLHRGSAFDSTEEPRHNHLSDSPLFDPLKEIGLDTAAIRNVIATYPARIVEEWTDITLAARERNGLDFFRISPAAYFMDNLKAAAAKRRRPPDWWHELRKQERRQLEEQTRRRDAPFAPAEGDFETYLATEARDTLDRITGQLIRDFVRQGEDEHHAKRRAADEARHYLQRRYEVAHRDRMTDDHTKD